MIPPQHVDDTNNMLTLSVRAEALRFYRLVQRAASLRSDVRQYVTQVIGQSITIAIPEDGYTYVRWNALFVPTAKSITEEYTLDMVYLARKATSTDSNGTEIPSIQI